MKIDTSKLRAMEYGGSKGAALYMGDTLLWERPNFRCKFAEGAPGDSHWVDYNGSKHYFDEKSPEVIRMATPLRSLGRPMVSEDVTEITEMPSLGQVTSMKNAFYGCTQLRSIDVSGWDLSNVVEMHQIFHSCGNLTSLDVSDWDVSKATSMYALFYNCKSLGDIDVSRWDTSSLTDGNRMFNNCTGMQSLDVSRWDTSSLTKMEMMFCWGRMEELDMRGWDFKKVKQMNDAFSGASRLRLVRFSEVDFSGLDDTAYTMFRYDNKLTTIEGEIRNIDRTFYLSDSPLDAATTGMIVRNLAEVSNGAQLALSAVSYGHLSEEEIASATAKGWTITHK